MKPPVVIALIVAGMALIVTPPVARSVHARSLLQALSTQGGGSIQVDDPVSPTYALGCWAAGILNLGAALGFAERRRDPSNAPATD